MATQLNITEATALLKQRFNPQAVELLVYKDNPAFAAMKKMTTFGGTNMKVPVRIGVNQGQSATFATSQTNAYAPLQRAFEVTRKPYYTIAKISGESIAAGKGDLNTFIDLVSMEITDALLSHTNDLAGQLYRDGSGAIGQISGSVTSGAVTLTEPDDITQFEVGMALQARQTGGSLESGVGYVISVNRAAGTFVVSTSQGGAAATPTGWSDTDYLLVQGNNNAVISGFDAWLPTTAPSSGESFFGVDRSIDRTRLAGVVYDGTGQTLQQAIVNGLALGAREGAQPDLAFCSFDTFSALVNELGAKVQYIDPKANTLGGIPFRGVEIFGSRNAVRVVPDRSAPSGVVYALTSASWTLASAGGAPMVDEFGQGMWLRESDDDGYELRVKSYANLFCNAPGHNVKILVTV